MPIISEICRNCQLSGLSAISSKSAGIASGFRIPIISVIWRNFRKCRKHIISSFSVICRNCQKCQKHIILSFSLICQNCRKHIISSFSVIFRNSWKCRKYIILDLSTVCRNYRKFAGIAGIAGNSQILDNTRGLKFFSMKRGGWSFFSHSKRGVAVFIDQKSKGTFLIPIDNIFSGESGPPMHMIFHLIMFSQWSY